MDFLDNIMKGMDKNKPPPVIKADKVTKHQEMIMKKEKQILTDFKAKSQKKIHSFLKNETPFLEFSPMEKVFRQIISEVADDSGLYSQSFGIEGENRYIVVYKKEYNLTEDEMEARRNGDFWNEQIAEEYKLRRKLAAEEKTKELEQEREENKQSKKLVTKAKNINIKMMAESAIPVNEKQTYGFVPSENKKDQRSIEQTLADIQQKKKLKTQHNSNPI